MENKKLTTENCLRREKIFRSYLDLLLLTFYNKGVKVSVNR